MSNLEDVRDSMVADFGDVFGRWNNKVCIVMTKVVTVILYFILRREYVEPRSALRAVQQQEEWPKEKEHKHSRVGREHPQGHWRVACRVQHTHMPAYCNTIPQRVCR